MNGSGAPRRGAIAFLGACLLLCAPMPGAGQWGDILALQPGDSVRLRLPGALRVHASMLGMRSDTLLLRLQGIEQDWPVSGYDIVSLDRYGDRNPREGLRHGVVLGMVVGLFAGAAVGGVVDVARGGEEDVTIRVLSSALRWAGLGAVTGAVAGGVIGGRRPGRGWVALALPVR